LTNAHLEAWGPFGRGWSLKRFSAQIVEPQAIPLVGYPRAWSPGFTEPLLSEVVYLDAKTDGELEKYKGKLKGAVVLTSSPREIRARFEAPGTRITDAELLKMANANARQNFLAGRGSTNSPSATNEPPTRTGFGRGRRGEGPAPTNAVPALSTTNTPSAAASRAVSSPQRLSFAAKEGAALVVTTSAQGDGGTFFVDSAAVPTQNNVATNAPARSSPWATNAPAIPPQIVLAAEDYNRLVRMIQQGEKLKMAADLQVCYHTDDLMAYNTVAEIPGSDLKDEIVMLGAHMDSWHSGTGATDNGAGVAVTLEAVRILRALELRPRRTVRIGLWSGEEQGLLGSKAYVARHFGYYTNSTNSTAVRSPRDSSNDRRMARSTNAVSRSGRKLIRQREYEKLSAYFNLDNGTGKIRGVYMQGNDAVRPLFRQWLEPFRDLGAETLTLSNTGGTDHQSFDGIGLPGFQFIQDTIEYWSRTHHSNADVFDRIQADDLKQAAVIMAAFVYNAAMQDERLPRKPGS
ncbi:MAG TPA: M20/M25/M40 family metallo-hydrolase, partial [Verrucomicrobiae bacterium]